MRPVLVVAAMSVLALASCSAEATDQTQDRAERVVATERTTTARPADAPTDGSEMIETVAGEGGSIGCSSPEDCDVEFTVDSVAATDCVPPGGMAEQDQVVRVDIEVEVRNRVNYPDALDIFNSGSWSAVTEDGYTLRSLDIAFGCDNQDLSLFAYGINAGEKVRNRIDFALPADVATIQLQPSALDGGGWSWPVQ